jgi:hypothetical protein
MPAPAGVVIDPQVALCSQAEYEHEHNNQSFRFPCSTGYFGSIVVRDQLDWLGAARVLAGSGPSKVWLKSKNPECDAVRREREEDWG